MIILIMKTTIMMMMMMRVSNLKLSTEKCVLLHIHFVPGQISINLFSFDISESIKYIRWWYWCWAKSGALCQLLSNKVCGPVHLQQVQVHPRHSLNQALKETQLMTNAFCRTIGPKDIFDADWDAFCKKVGPKNIFDADREPQRRLRSGTLWRRKLQHSRWSPERVQPEITT